MQARVFRGTIPPAVKLGFHSGRIGSARSSGTDLAAWKVVLIFETTAVFNVRMNVVLSWIAELNIDSFRATDSASVDLGVCGPVKPGAWPLLMPSYKKTAWAYNLALNLHLLASFMTADSSASPVWSRLLRAAPRLCPFIITVLESPTGWIKQTKATQQSYRDQPLLKSTFSAPERSPPSI
jgi:hypothetical protein